MESRTENADAGPIVVPTVPVDHGCWIIRFFDTDIGFWYYTGSFSSEEEAKTFALTNLTTTFYRIIRIPGSEAKGVQDGK